MKQSTVITLLIVGMVVVGAVIVLYKYFDNKSGLGRFSLSEYDSEKGNSLKGGLKLKNQ